MPDWKILNNPSANFINESYGNILLCADGLKPTAVGGDTSSLTSLAPMV